MKTIRIVIVVFFFLISPWFLLSFFKNGANGPAASFSSPIAGMSCIQQYISFDTLFFSNYSGWFYSSWLPFLVIGIADILRMQGKNRKLLLASSICLLTSFFAWSARCRTVSVGTALFFSLYQFFIGWGIAHSVEKWKTYSTLTKLLFALLFLLFSYEVVGFVHVFLVHYPQ